MDLFQIKWELGQGYLTLHWNCNIVDTHHKLHNPNHVFVYQFKPSHRRFQVTKFPVGSSLHLPLPVPTMPYHVCIALRPYPKAAKIQHVEGSWISLMHVWLRQIWCHWRAIRFVISSVDIFFLTTPSLKNIYHIQAAMHPKTHFFSTHRCNLSMSAAGLQGPPNHDPPWKFEDLSFKLQLISRRYWRLGLHSKDHPIRLRRGTRIGGTAGTPVIYH